MSRKPIKYSSHAIIRKFERDISDDEIIDILFNSDYAIKSIDGRKISSKKIGKQTVNVVYKEENTFIFVITVY